MPFSVVLDFREDIEGIGSCLQVAAQSGKGQGTVLNGKQSLISNCFQPRKTRTNIL